MLDNQREAPNWIPHHVSLLATVQLVGITKPTLRRSGERPARVRRSAQELISQLLAATPIEPRKGAQTLEHNHQ
jgi:hypothetical protein